MLEQVHGNAVIAQHTHTLLFAFVLDLNHLYSSICDIREEFEQKIIIQNFIDEEEGRLLPLIHLNFFGPKIERNCN